MGALERVAEELARRAGLKEVPKSAVIAAIVVTLVLGGGALVRWWPRAAAAPVVVSQSESAEPAEPGDASGPAEEATAPVAPITVHVVGAVRHEGVYALPAGSRAADGVAAAGGALGDAVLDAVNLARLLTDGEQLLIPDEDSVDKVGATAPTAAAASAAGATGAPGQPVNINTADEAQLDTLPGVGPSTAQKIVAEREANGAFASVEDLGRVSGIGPKKLEQLRELVCVR